MRKMKIIELTEHQLLTLQRMVKETIRDMETSIENNEYFYLPETFEYYDWLLKALYNSVDNGYDTGRDERVSLSALLKEERTKKLNNK